MLCAVVSLLEEWYEGNEGTFADVLSKAHPGLRGWHEKHTTKEASRVRREAAQKLSARERRLLNLDANGDRLDVPPFTFRKNAKRR